MTQVGGADRRRLRRKYLSLGAGELAAAAVFALFGALKVGPGLDRPAVFAWWSALTPLLLVLIQAGCYWLLARAWVANRPMPRAPARVYSGFRLLDVLALTWGLVAVLLWSPGGWAMVGFMAVWAFGAVEFVNYFVVRLAYPVRSWPVRVRRRQRPRLAEDIAHALSGDADRRQKPGP